MEPEVLNELPVRVIKAVDPFNGNKEVDVLVDGDYDGEYFAQFKWRLTKTGHVVMLPLGEPIINDKTGESLGRKFKGFEYLHHLVLHPKEGLWVTHKNKDPLDCRSANLEYLTPSQSAVTRSQKRHLSAPRKGLWATPYRGVQRMGHSINGRQTVLPGFKVSVQGRYIGWFPKVEQAARAYDKEAKRIWGDRAVLNFKEEEDD